MATKTYSGRSLLFNVISILFNLTGVTFIVLGFHENFEAQASLFKTVGFLFLMASIAGIVIFKGRLLMASFSRVLVGGLFIVSGLVKANDPLGFAYKLEEYFEDGALAYRIKEWFSAPGFSLEFLMNQALFLSVLICIVEIVLGVLIILGGKIKLATWLTMAMMVFFTFLTWHTATCDGTKKFVDRDTYLMSDPLATIKLDEAKENKELKIISQTKTELVIEEKKQPQCVDDCGCFGDAMKGSVGRSLTPHESLWKDIILVYLSLWILLAQFKINPNSRTENFVFVPLSLLVILFFSWIFTWYFPLIFGFVVLLSSLWILKSKKKWLSNYWVVILLTIGWCAILAVYVLRYDAIKDYRAYAVGNNLLEKMKDGEEGIYESVLIYKNKKTGKEVEYESTSKVYTDSKVWEDPEWEYVSMTQKEIKATRIPSITEQFNPFIGLSELSEEELALPEVAAMFDQLKMKGVKLKDIAGDYLLEVPLAEYNLDDYPESEYAFVDSVAMLNPEVSELSIRDLITSAPKIVVISAKNLRDADWSALGKLKKIVSWCQAEKIPVVMICSAGRDEINAFRESNKFKIAVFANDETELKAISRSNPAVLVIEHAVVKAKYPHRSLPALDQFKRKHGKRK